MGRVRNCGYEEDQRTLDGGLVFLFFIVTNRSVVFYYSKVKGVAPCDALLGYNNNYLRSKMTWTCRPWRDYFVPLQKMEKAKSSALLPFISIEVILVLFP